jgi:hypothetical protein
MTGTAQIETDELDEIYEFLVNADVIDGPPGFRDTIAELWPDLHHKLKPPKSEVH